MKDYRVKSIRADFGVGFAYLEVPPTFKPPSLPDKPEERATKLMQRLLKDDERQVEIFKRKLLLRQPKNTPMVGVTTTHFDPSPIFMPPLYFSSKKK